MIKHVSFLYTKVKKGINSIFIKTCVLYEMMGLVYEIKYQLRQYTMLY